MSGQTLQKSFVPLPAGATAVYTSSGLDHYRHPDWLGSARLSSSTSPSATGFVSYAPFGETETSGGTADPSFTGQNQDTVSNLYDFPAREYDPLAGRWPSPDPARRASTRLAFPQSWDRYAYVMNNPLGLIDPTGLDCVYLNDDGTSTEFIDTNSSAGECGSTGGYWVPGTVDPNSININVDSGWISAASNLGTFGAACNGAGCGPSGMAGLNPYGGVPADPVTGQPLTPQPPSLWNDVYEGAVIGGFVGGVAGCIVGSVFGGPGPGTAAGGLAGCAAFGLNGIIGGAATGAFGGAIDYWIHND